MAKIMEYTPNKDDQDPNKLEPSPEEKQAEEEALQENSDEEIRNRVKDDLGLDEDVDTDLIDKIVKSRKEEKKKLSTAIRQKIAQREKAQAPKEQKKEETPAQGKSPAEINEENLLKKVDERLADRDLSALGLSDKLKKEVKSYAELNKVSVKEAYDSKYIQFQKKEEDDKVASEDAGIGGQRKTRLAETEFEKIDPSKDFDLSTEEGRKGFEAYKVKLKARG